jgi:hypothetical protein
MTRTLLALVLFVPFSWVNADATHSASKPVQKKVSSATKSTKPKKASVHSAAHKGKKQRLKKTSWRHKGQQKIDSERTREIQEALIREHYLDGEATGQWNAETQKALEKYQSDNGWQTKTVPDSRALIKLGLGPDHEHLLNPESAMTTVPPGSQTNSRTSVTPVAADPATNQPQK